jgi:hypothetical protein
MNYQRVFDIFIMHAKHTGRLIERLRYTGPGLRVRVALFCPAVFIDVCLFSRYYFIHSFSVGHSLSRQTENLRENIPTPEKFSTESNATRTRKSEPVYLNLTISKVFWSVNNNAFRSEKRK